MVIDHSNKKNKSMIIEVLVGTLKTKVWVPIMATQAYLVNTDGEINKIEEIRVRDLSKE